MTTTYTPLMVDNVYTTMFIAPEGTPIPEGMEVAPHWDDTVETGSVLGPDGLTWTPPTPDPTLTNLNRVQFKAIIALLGSSLAAVDAAIDTIITDPTENMIAKILVSDSDYYARNHDLFDQLKGELGFTDAAIDAAWPVALAI